MKHRVLFLTADLGGNVPPTLAVARALEQREIGVEVAGLHPRRNPFSQVSFPPAIMIKSSEGSRWRSWTATLRLMIDRRTTSAVSELINERRPDMVIVDCMLPAVIDGALRNGTPVVVLFHTLGEFWLHSFDRGPAGWILAVLGLRPRRLWSRASRRILLADPDLDPSYLDRTPSEYAWAGTSEVGSAPVPRRSPRPRVLVALSSNDFPGMATVYRRIIAGLAALPVEVIVTTGRDSLRNEVGGAENVTVLGWADHAELLPEIDLLVGHGRGTPRR